MIWYLTLLVIIDFIFWPLEVINVWQSKNLWFIHHMTFSLISYFELWMSLILWGQMHSGLSEVKKRYQNGIGTPKNLWFDTSHDLFSLNFLFQPLEVSKFWRLRPPGSSEVKKGVSKWNWNTKKTPWFDTLHDLFSLIDPICDRLDATCGRSGLPKLGLLLQISSLII